MKVQVLITTPSGKRFYSAAMEAESVEEIAKQEAEVFSKCDIFRMECEDGSWLVLPEGIAKNCTINVFKYSQIN